MSLQATQPHSISALADDQAQRRECQAIPPDEIHRIDGSFCDGLGRLFAWRGQLYRAIDPRAWPACRRLLDTGVIERLVERKLLVDTRLEPLSLEDYAAVLWHRRLPYVTYPSEWNGPMLRDSALRVLELEAQLMPQGLTLEDPHPWNLVFDATQPVLVDLGSIVTLGEDGPLWPAFDRHFEPFYLRPLLARAHGFGAIARAMFWDYTNHLEASEIEALTGRRDAGTCAAGGIRRRVAMRLPEWVRRPLCRAIKPIRRSVLQRRLAMLDALRATIASLNLAPVHPRLGPCSTASRSRQAADRAVMHVLQTHRPATVLDLGTGDARHAFAAASAGATVAALDLDERALDRLHATARAQCMRIIPVVMDLRYPTPAHGMCNAEHPPAFARLKSDVVLAIDLIDQLVTERHFGFSEIARTIAGFTRRCALIEFFAQGHEPGRPAFAGMPPDWYSAARLQAALLREFASVAIHHFGSPDRLYFECMARQPDMPEGAGA